MSIPLSVAPSRAPVAASTSGVPEEGFTDTRVRGATPTSSERPPDVTQAATRRRPTRARVMEPGPTDRIQWFTVRDAAEILSVSPDALRRKIERAACKAKIGVEAQIDGVRARKFGGQWRVRFEEGWLT